MSRCASVDDSPLYSKGFTLIELMVVISIFLVISTIVIFNYQGFSSSASLQNLTDDIALSIRKAQSFAIGSRGVTINGISSFSNSYGVHFSDTPIPPSNNTKSSDKSFVMFSTSSLSPNNGYVAKGNSCADGTNNCVESFNISTADIIKNIKLYNGTTEVLFSSPAYLDIIFTRPNMRAFFCYRKNADTPNCDPTSASISNAEIIISNGQLLSDEKFKTISIQNTGQISISDQ